MRYRKYVLAVVVLSGLFIAANYAVWKAYTQDLLTDRRYDGGDLARMGYLPGSKMYRKNSVDLDRVHIRQREYRGGTVDVVTIGDSFSNGGGGGRNRFYQDYIASENSCSVMNLDSYQGLDFLTTISVLNNNGFLDRVRPRYVVIGATERGFRDMAGETDFSRSITLTEFRSLTRIDYYSGMPEVLFVNNGNLKFLLNQVSFIFRDRGFFSNVRSADLVAPMFSVKDASRLLYLPYKANFGQREVEKLNENLNALADRLAAKGIRLIYIPFVDKYTLYSRWIAKPAYPVSRFFEMLGPLPKRYAYVDTKAALTEELEKGEKDIFYADDTHTSWKASKKICEKIGNL